MKRKQVKNIAIWVFSVSLAITLYFLASIWLSDDERLMENHSMHVIESFIFTFFVSASIFLANISIVTYIDKLLPWQNNVTKRIVIEFILTAGSATLIITLFSMVFLESINVDYNAKNLFDNIIIANIVNIIATSIVEGSDFYKSWKASLVETERLQKENIRSQYEALKNQVNPHFLFNSLNTLSSLVHQDADKAEKFIDEFAKFYRYSLDFRNKTVVPLKEEMDLVKAYIYLQQIRFGGGLLFHQEINGSCLEALLPPFSLQMLVENAIKHNEVSDEKPLNIEMRINNGFIEVNNNLQYRPTSQHSTGVGLKNLEEKYKIICENNPEFIQQDNVFIARIPLIFEEE